MICTVSYTGWQNPEKVNEPDEENNDENGPVLTSPDRKGAVDATKAPSATEGQQPKGASKPGSRQARSDG